MAHFYAEVQGDRGVSSRVGSKHSGIWSWTRGWTLGIEVVGTHTDDGEDEFEIWITGGSNAKSNGRKKIGTLTEEGFVRVA